MRSCVACLLALLNLVAGAGEGWENVDAARVLREPAKELWRASFAAGADAFETEFRDGAEAEVSFAEGAMTVKKTNAKGYVIVKARRGFSFPVGTRLRSYADAEVTGSDPNYSLAFPRILDARNRLHCCLDLDVVGVFMGGGEKIAFLANTPPGRAERRFSHFQVRADGGTDLVPALVIAGAPSVSRWVRWGVEDYEAADSAWVKVRSAFHADESGKTNLEECASFARRLAADVEHTAKVVKEDGRVRLLVDGRDELPVFYKNPGSWGQNWGDYNGRAMYREGVRLQCFEVGGGRSWGKDGEWNVEATVADIRDQMRVSPEALVILSFTCTASKEYAERHPDEVWRHPDGQACVGDWGKMKSRHHTDPNKKPYSDGCWPWISFSSKAYRAYLEGVIDRLVGRLREEGLSKRIVGVHVCGYHDGQFAPYRADFSKPVKEGFRDYLVARYGKAPEDLELPVPSAKEFFCDPATERGRFEHDFNTYLHLAPFRFEEAIARQFKKSFAKDVFCIHWCMGAYGGEMNCAFYFDAFCRSDAMDGLVAQPSYIRRLPGNGIGNLLPTASFSEHGKLYVDELDLRAWGVIPGYVKEPSLGGLGFAMDLPEWQAVNRKMTGRMIAADQGYWYFDISGGFYNPDPVEHEIGSSTTAYRALRQSKKVAWRPSAAFVVDGDGMLWRNLIGVRKHPGGIGTVNTQLEVLAASGVPFDLMTYEDAATIPLMLASAKTVVLAGFYEMDDARRRFLAKLLSEGKTVVLLWGTDGFRGKVRKWGLDPYVEAVDRARESEFLSRYHAEWTRYMLGVEAGEVALEFRPESYAFDERDGTEVLARYRDGQPAAIRRGNVYAFGYSCGLTPRLFNRIVRESGGYVPCVRPGLQVNMNGSFVSVNALDNGRYDFRLPFPCRVVNLKTGLPAKVKGDVLPLGLVAGETCWFQLEK